MKKRWYKMLFLLLFCLTMGGCNSSYDGEKTVADSNLAPYGSAVETGRESENDTLEVHYIDIGQGDSILIKQGDAAMLIDAGNNSKGTAVWSYLISQGVDVLTYAVGTHPDADHIGGLDVVLYKLDCETVFLPDCENDTRTYEELLETLDSKQQRAIVPKQGEVYALGKAEFQILTDTGKDYGGNHNNFSIALRLTFGENSFLFTGDAEEEAEEDMIASGLPISSDVYKAAHHGADTANTEAFLQTVCPKYCVISCGQDNSYGHPRAGVLNNLRAMDVSVFRTDEQGTIVAVSDGENITFNCSPSDSWKAGEPTGNGNIQMGKEDVEHIGNAGGVSGTEKDRIAGSSGSEKDNTESDHDFVNTERYVLNTKTKKFHLKTCKSAAQITDKNKQVSDQTREELIEEGYELCKNCNP